jgi:hypothetical protein
MSMHYQHHRDQLLIPNPASQVVDDSLLNQFLALSTGEQVIDASVLLMNRTHLTNLLTEGVDF